MTTPLLVIMGPTATGKTRLAALVASEIDGEIISADSRQVYRGMDLGTGKDYDDYNVDGFEVPYHLIDIVDPGYKYSVYEFLRDFRQKYIEITNRGKVPILCGGTGLYIDGVVRGYNLVQVPMNTALRKELEGKDLDQLSDILRGLRPVHNVTDTLDCDRAIRAIEIESYYRDHDLPERFEPEMRSCVTGILYSRQAVRERITARLTQRLEEGMIDEVKSLLQAGVKAEDLFYYGLEYRYVTAYIQGEMSYEEMYGKLNTAIHGFSKRQMTWFRRMERKGVNVHWIDGTLPESEKTAAVINLYKGYKQKKGPSKRDGPFL